MNPIRGFASDNQSGLHPEILEAIARANIGHCAAYGADPWTERAVECFRKHFGKGAEVFFVFNGTGANVLGLSAATRRHHAIFCSESAHIAVDECGAPERFTGCKLLPVPAPDGKLTVPAIEARLSGVGDQHHVQPRVISITQATELGTVYTSEEIRALADFAHRNGLFLHMDGARISNAAASLGASFKELVTDPGVDVLSFGGTKNGLMGAEAVVFLNRQLAEDFKFVRKQGMQLASKMRFVAAQFEALLGSDLWLRNARHSNSMARLLEAEVRGIPGLTVTQPVQANGVFASIPSAWTERLQKQFPFYVWNDLGDRNVVRWMCSFDTSEEDVRAFVRRVREIAD